MPEIMTFDQALRAIADQLRLDPDLLIAYAAEDTIPGSNSDGNGLLHHAIPYTADGKLLYGLVRALRPRRILEAGTSYGGSANHLLAALVANGSGRLVTVDIDPLAGSHIDPAYEGWYEIVIADICEYVQRPEVTGFDFIHEDASHEVDTVYAVYAALPHLAPDSCVILSHDTAFSHGNTIREGIRRAGYGALPEYQYEDSPCGFGVWRFEGVRHG